MSVGGSVRLRLSLAVSIATAVFLSVGVWFTLDRVEASATASARQVEERALDGLVALNEGITPVPIDPATFDSVDPDAEMSAAVAMLSELQESGHYGEVAELFGLDDSVVILAGTDGSLVEVDLDSGRAFPVEPDDVGIASELRILPTLELFDVAAFLTGEDPFLFEDLGVVEVPFSESAVVVGAQDLDEVEASIAAMRGPLWFGAAILTALTGLLAWVLTGRALRPVSAMTRRVAEISGGTLHERVTAPESTDEIAELAHTMNDMLDRLESSDQRRRRFVADASHELRSPVATIRSVAEVAARRPEQADWPEVVDDVLTETHRLEDLVADLLTLARADEGQAVVGGTEVDLEDIVLAQIGRVRRVPVDGVGVTAARVEGRSDELDRMVRHLLDNAIRHADGQVVVRLTSGDGDAVLTVDDDGPGIAVADRALVFERFVRLDEARSRDRGGAGLGLAVVAGIVSAHGGTIAVAESPLGGARLEVVLPLGPSARAE